MPKTGEVQIRVEWSRENGYLVAYLRLRPGKVHTTYELSPGIAADVDREGRVLGVEIVKTFSTKAKRPKFRRSVDLDEIQKAVEARFSVKLDREFKEVREAGRAVFAP